MCDLFRCTLSQSTTYTFTSNHHILYINFLASQNNYPLRLINTLLKRESAFELLQEKLLSVFKLNKITKDLDIVEEQFLMKLTVTRAFNIIEE